MTIPSDIPKLIFLYCAHLRFYRDGGTTLLRDDLPGSLPSRLQHKLLQPQSQGFRARRKVRQYQGNSGIEDVRYFICHFFGSAKVKVGTNTHLFGQSFNAKLEDMGGRRLLRMPQ
ncbi:MAG: hypothetical protein HHJ15_07450 [Rhodoferax sp.]|nr:hypothetical protein [Rhodoferax sp.]